MTPVRYPHVSPHRPHCRYHHNNIIITHHKRSLTSRWPVTASAPGDKLGEKWQRWPSVDCGVTQQNVQLGLSKVSGKAEMSRVSSAPAAATCCRCCGGVSTVSSGHRNDPTSISCLWSRIPAASLALALRAAVLKFLQFLRILLPTKSRPPFRQ